MTELTIILSHIHWPSFAIGAILTGSIIAFILVWATQDYY